MAALPNTFNSTNERDANGANSRIHWVPRHQWPDGRIGTIDPTFPRLTAWARRDETVVNRSVQ